MTQVKTLLSILALLLITSNAQAALITLNDSATQTLDGQDFNFTFTNVPTVGTGGSFVIHAQGDYDGGTSENLVWDIEGIIGDTVGGFVNGVGIGGGYDFATVYQPLGNIEFQKTYSLSQSELNAIISDGTVGISIDLNSSVGLFNPPNFVEVTFTFNDEGQVPAPAPLALIGIGLMALNLKRKRKG